MIGAGKNSDVLWLQSLRVFEKRSKEIFGLLVNHGQIPLMPMTNKSKHNNCGFKKWVQIFPRENFPGATTEGRTES